MSHGFLMVQIEVSLLPLRVGRSRQAGRGSARTALPPVKPAAGLGLRLGGGRAPLGGQGTPAGSTGASSRVGTVTLAGRGGAGRSCPPARSATEAQAHLSVLTEAHGAPPAARLLL